MNLQTSIESANSIPLAGQSVTISFWARAGANFSSAGSALNLWLPSGSGIDQNVQSTFSGVVDIVNTNVTLTTSWQRFTRTGLMPADKTQLGFSVSYIPTGTAGANDWFEITGVQLEAGTVATPFRRNAPSIQAELAACQRYYEIGQGFMFVGYFALTNVRIANSHYKVTKRANPTFTTSVIGGGLTGGISYNSVDNTSWYISNGNSSTEAYSTWIASAEL
jgi:hypothetical protein